MKNILKVLAAVLVVALPFVVASCSSDDDNKNEPKVRTYYWEVGVDWNKISANERGSVTTAWGNLNQLIVNGLKKANYNVDADKYAFTITCKDDELVQNNRSIKGKFMEIMGTDDFIDLAELLPERSYLLVTLEGKDPIVNELLR